MLCCLTLSFVLKGSAMPQINARTFHLSNVADVTPSEAQSPLSAPASRQASLLSTCILCKGLLAPIFLVYISKSLVCGNLFLSLLLYLRLVEKTGASLPVLEADKGRKTIPLL